jgi:CHAT domain-containing protein/tetratricopeptide (TPR) repeat protein
MNRRPRNRTISLCGRALLVVMLPALSAHAAQRAQNEQRAAADKLAAEAVQLANEGTKESLAQAISKFLAAVPLYHAANDKANEADTLNSIGTLYSNLGEQQQALAYFVQALPLYTALGDRGGEAVEFNNMGSVYIDLGELQKALDAFGQALPRLRAVKDRKGEAITLNNMGRLYFQLGDKQKALTYFGQSLTLNRTLGEKGGEAITLTNMGDISFAAGQKQQALAYYTQALPLYRAVGDRRSEAVALSQIGQVYAALDNLPKAVEYYQQALPLSRAVGDRSGEAQTLSLVGSAFLAIGERQEALETYRQILPLYQTLGDRSSEARTLFNIAFNERGTNKPEAALRDIEAALAILETLRGRIESRELRSTYFASVQEYYEFYIDLLMQLHKQQPNAGYDGRALQASERARARALLETLAEAGADIRQGVDAALLARERALQQALNDAARAQIKLLAGPHTDADATAVAKDLDALTSEYEQVETQIRQTSPRYAALTQPQPLALPEVQQLLDQDTLLLEYALGREHSFLWVVAPDSIKSYELAKRTEIEEAARQFYAILTDARKWAGSASGNTAPQRGLFPTNAAQAATSTAAVGVPAAAARLSQLVLAPVAAQLGNKRLLIVADGALQFVPFAALPLAQPDNAPAYRPLITKHETVNLPSASTLAVLRQEIKERKPAEKILAVLADPVFMLNDARFTAAPGVNTRTDNVTATQTAQRGLALNVTKAAADAGLTEDAGLRGIQIPRLPGTRKEAEQLLTLVPAASQLHVFDFAANRAAVTDAELGAYRYVHFATHGFLDSQHPELSGILLSMYDAQGVPQDGFLRAHEVFNLKLAAELVTLSACQTGLGKEIKGEGLVGLTRGFMYAGAPRVVVSLWNVSDEGTAELMTRFYRELLQNKQRPAAALQAAQISMLKEQRFAAPFYWAAFTLQGEWR